MGGIKLQLLANDIAQVKYWHGVTKLRGILSQHYEEFTYAYNSLTFSVWKWLFLSVTVNEF